MLETAHTPHLRPIRTILLHHMFPEVSVPSCAGPLAGSSRRWGGLVVEELSLRAEGPGDVRTGPGTRHLVAEHQRVLEAQRQARLQADDLRGRRSDPPASSKRSRSAALGGRLRGRLPAAPWQQSVVGSGHRRPGPFRWRVHDRVVVGVDGRAAGFAVAPYAAATAALISV